MYISIIISPGNKDSNQKFGEMDIHCFFFRSGASYTLACCAQYILGLGDKKKTKAYTEGTGLKPCCLFVCLFGFLTSSSTTRLHRGRAPRQERLTILRAATHETELGDHDFCLSRSHYTDTDPTCREWAATAGIEPGTSAQGVARSTH